jgi:hypothetical protein
VIASSVAPIGVTASPQATHANRAGISICIERLAAPHRRGRVPRRCFIERLHRGWSQPREVVG